MRGGGSFVASFWSSGNYALVLSPMQKVKGTLSPVIPGTAKTAILNEPLGKDGFLANYDIKELQAADVLPAVQTALGDTTLAKENLHPFFFDFYQGDNHNLSLENLTHISMSGLSYAWPNEVALYKIDRSANTATPIPGYFYTVTNTGQADFSIDSSGLYVFVIRAGEGYPIDKQAAGGIAGRYSTWRDRQPINLSFEKKNASFTIPAQMTVYGAKASSHHVTYGLFNTTNAQDPAQSAKEKLVGTGTSDNEGNITFSNLTLDKEGEYIFRVVQLNDDLTPSVKNTQSFEVHLTVTRHQYLLHAVNIDYSYDTDGNAALDSITNDKTTQTDELRGIYYTTPSAGDKINDISKIDVPLDNADLFIARLPRYADTTGALPILYQVDYHRAFNVFRIFYNRTFNLHANPNHIYQFNMAFTYYKGRLTQRDDGTWIRDTTQPLKRVDSIMSYGLGYVALLPGEYIISYPEDMGTGILAQYKKDGSSLPEGEGTYASLWWRTQNLHEGYSSENGQSLIDYYWQRYAIAMALRPTITALNNVDGLQSMGVVSTNAMNNFPVAPFYDVYNGDDTSEYFGNIKRYGFHYDEFDIPYEHKDPQEFENPELYPWASSDASAQAWLDGFMNPNNKMREINATQAWTNNWQNTNQQTGYAVAFTDNMLTGHTSIHFSNTLVHLNKLVEGSNVPLNGASLTLVRKDHADSPTVESWVSNGSSHDILLGNGTYELQETAAPAGYEMAKPIVFSVTDGKVVIQDGIDGNSQGGGQGSGTATEVSDYTINMLDKKADPTPEPNPTPVPDPDPTPEPAPDPTPVPEPDSDPTPVPEPDSDPTSHPQLQPSKDSTSRNQQEATDLPQTGDLPNTPIIVALVAALIFLVLAALNYKRYNK